jgi:phosphopantothenoylcysteine decarboxylase/phosphopantothenate--cysteine ligase
MADSHEGRNVVLGVSGSIAAYKAVEVARLLITRGYEVQVVMTKSGQEFVGPATFEAVTGKKVITDFWDGSEVDGIGHITVADWADTFLICPATADIIAKLAMGFADTPLLAIALATKAPILIAPAMNVNMYENPVTQTNIEILRSREMQIIEPEVGALACGWNGQGRLADPWDIYHHAMRSLASMDFAGKRIVITTGPTREAIDPVRFISNRSSGKMGVAIAREAYRRGAEVTLIHGQVPVKAPSMINRVPFTSAEELKEAVCAAAYPTSGKAPDVVIMVAAVADFRAKVPFDRKVKKVDVGASLELVENTDILAELGARRGENPGPILVGFAVETGEIEDLLTEVRSKLSKKRVDMIVGNFAEEALDLDTNRVWIVDKNGRQQEVATASKGRVANKILDAILKL